MAGAGTKCLSAGKMLARNEISRTKKEWEREKGNSKASLLFLPDGSKSVS